MEERAGGWPRPISTTLCRLNGWEILADNADVSEHDDSMATNPVFITSHIQAQARSLIRKMTGKSQAHLIEAEGGALYVVTFLNNPQHRRILVNEWLASVYLRHLQISVPETVTINLSAEFIKRTPDLFLSIGSHRHPVPPGLHFGSRMAVHPDHVALFDCVPAKLLDKIENRAEFLGTLVFDKWVCNTDSRQAVFFRAMPHTGIPAHGARRARVGLYAQMIDHGYAFNGQYWGFNDSPIQGLYFCNRVYQEVRSLDSFQPWLDMVRAFPIDTVAEAWKDIPFTWLGKEASHLDRLLDTLLKRRSRVPDLITELQRHRACRFSKVGAIQ